MRRRARFAAISGALILAAVACGGGDTEDLDEIDAASSGGSTDASATEADADTGEPVDASAGESDGSGGFFCDQEGDNCPDGKACCSDGLCRSECAGGGSVPCQCSADCPTGGAVCCATPSEDPFCTPKKSCEDFGGDVIDTCT